jgi:hypothetical protein
MLDVTYINRRPPTSKRDRITSHSTPEQIAQDCLAAARGNPERAILLAGRHAHGAKMRAVVAAIGTAFLRASTAADGRAP